MANSERVAKRGVDRVIGTKIAFTVIILVFAIMRGVYMSLPASVYNDPIAMLIVFEIPSILFFVMYMTLLYIWAEVIYKVKTVSSKMGAVEKVWHAYLGINAAMILIWIVFVIVYFVIEEVKPLPCQTGDVIPKTRHVAVNAAYLWFIVGISVLFIVAVIVMGSVFLILVGRSRSQRRSQQRSTVLQLTMIVVFSFPPMFLVKTALLLWASLSNGVVPLIVFSLLEILPSYVLTYYIFPYVDDKKGSLFRSSSRSRSTRLGAFASRSKSELSSRTSSAQNSRTSSKKDTSRRTTSSRQDTIPVADEVETMQASQVTAHESTHHVSNSGEDSVEESEAKLAQSIPESSSSSSESGSDSDTM